MTDKRREDPVEQQDGAASPGMVTAHQGGGIDVRDGQLAEAVMGPMAEEALIRQRWSERRWNAAPDTVTANGTELKFPKPSSISVIAEDGAELLRIERTEDGGLDVSGAEDRWTEGAARFVAEVRRLLADG